jgi:uncharacterized protein
MTTPAADTFIDIHVHTRTVPGLPRSDGTRFASPEELIAQYDQMGVATGVLLPGVSPEFESQGQTVDEVLEICQRYPGRFVAFCNVDPRALKNAPDAPLGQVLRYYQERGCKGVGEVTCNLPFLDGRVQNLMKCAEELGWPLTFHMAPEIGNNYGLHDEPGMPQLEKCLERFGGLKFLGHSQAFWAEIAPLQDAKDRWGYPTAEVEHEGRVPQLLRKYPNLLGDLSAGSGANALTRDPGYAARFLEEFQDRLYFGTDICRAFQDCPLPGFLMGLRGEGKISEEVFRKVARDNARKLLGL